MCRVGRGTSAANRQGWRWPRRARARSARCAGSVTCPVLLVLFSSVDRSQPRLAALDPELIARYEKCRRCGQDPELDLRLAVIDREQSRPAARAEVPTAKLGRFTHAFELAGGPDAIERESRAAFLPAI